MKVLVTGTAGFIGSYPAMRLLARGDQVVGFDNMSDYYDVHLKKARLARFLGDPKYTLFDADMADKAVVVAAFVTHNPHRQRSSDKAVCTKLQQFNVTSAGTPSPS